MPTNGQARTKIIWQKSELLGKLELIGVFVESWRHGFAYDEADLLPS